MNVIDDTVAEFGRSIGIDALRLRPDGGTVLSIDTIGMLSFDVAGPGEDAVVISLSRPVPSSAASDPRRLLRLAHHDHAATAAVHVGAYRDQVVAATVVPREDFTLARINEVILLLDRRQQALDSIR